MIANLEEKFAGALLGAMVGDFIGATVDAESPVYIRKTFRNIGDILALKTVPEFTAGEMGSWSFHQRHAGDESH